MIDFANADHFFGALGAVGGAICGSAVFYLRVSFVTRAAWDQHQEQIIKRDKAIDEQLAALSRQVDKSASADEVADLRVEMADIKASMRHVDQNVASIQAGVGRIEKYLLETK